MQRFLMRANRFFDVVLDLRSRALIAAACIGVLAPTFVLPLWDITMYANQYPDGLDLSIHAWKLEAGNGGNDLREINVLNHYIGMRPLDPKDFTEFKWLPFALGSFVLFGLRSAVIGRMAGLVDLLVLFTYFGLFSLASFVHRLYVYGHYLDPTAAVKVEPFTPPIFGHQTLANFEVYSYPGLGSYLMALFPILLAAAAFLSWRSARREGTAVERAASMTSPGGAEASA